MYVAFMEIPQTVTRWIQSRFVSYPHVAHNIPELLPNDPRRSSLEHSRLAAAFGWRSLHAFYNANWVICPHLTHSIHNERVIAKYPHKYHDWTELHQQWNLHHTFLSLSLSTAIHRSDGTSTAKKYRKRKSAKINKELARLRGLCEEHHRNVIGGFENEEDRCPAPHMDEENCVLR